MHYKIGAEFNAYDSAVTVIEDDLLVSQSEINANSLHIHRSVEIPVGFIGVPPIWERERSMPHHRVGVRGDGKKACAAFFSRDGAGQDIDVCFRAERHEIVSLVFIDQADEA